MWNGGHRLPFESSDVQLIVVGGALEMARERGFVSVLLVNVEVGFYSGVETFAIHNSVDVALADEGAVQRLFLP